MLPARRYAEWLPGAPPRKTAPLFVFGLAAMIGVSLLPMLLGAGLAHVASLYRWGLIVVCGLLFGGAFVETRRRNECLPLREIPSSVEQFPATVTLYRETIYGEDEGLVVFVDGWLTFSGRRFDFSVRRDEVEANDSMKTTFGFDGPQGRHRAEIYPIGRGLKEAWTHWFWDRSDAVGNPLYPPVTPSAASLPLNPVWVHLPFLVLAVASTFPILPVLAALEGAMVAYTIGKEFVFQDARRRIARNEPPRRWLFRSASRSAKSLEGPKP